MTATKAKSSFLSLVLGGLVMTTIGASHALNNPVDWAKCKYCNARSKKCATDDKFFEDCMTKCPQSSKSDPLKKCRDAHFSAVKAKPTPTQPKVALNDLVSGTCEQKQALIKMHNAVASQHKKAPYSKGEEDYILSGCDDKKGTSSTSPSSAASSQPPTDLPPVFHEDATHKAHSDMPTDLPHQPPADIRQSQKMKPLPLPPSRRGSVANPQPTSDESSELSPMAKALQAQKGRLRSSGGPREAGSTSEESAYQPMPAPQSTKSLSQSSSGTPSPTQQASKSGDRSSLLSSLNSDNPMARLKPTKKSSVGDMSQKDEGPSSYTLTDEDKRVLNRRYAIAPDNLKESIAAALNKAKAENNRTDIAKYTAQQQFIDEKEGW